MAYLLLTLAALAWGANTVFGRLAVDQVSPMVLVSLRWLIAAALLVTFCQRQLRADWGRIRPHLGMICAMGALGFTAFNGLYYSAAHFTTAVHMGIVQGSIPVLVLTGAFAVDRIRISAGQVLGVAIGLLGVAVVASAGDLERLMNVAVNRGDLLMIVGCVLYAAYTIGLRRAPQVSTFGLLAVMALASFLASLPLAAAEWFAGSLRWPTPLGWGLVAAIAIFPSLLAQAWFIEGVQRIGPARAGVFVNLVPVFSSVLGVTFLSEPFEAFHAAALSLVLGGIGLCEWAGARG